MLKFRLLSFGRRRSAKRGSGATAETADGLSAEVVYKTDDGVAVLHRKWGTTDSPDPERWEDAPELVWYEFA